MNQRTTEELMHVLNSIHSSEELLRFTMETRSDIAFPSFSKFLEHHLQASELTAGELIRKSEIQRNYGYQILNGNKKPGRDKVLAFCLALKLPLDDVQRALTIAGEAILYPKNSRDSIIIFSIGQGLSVLETNQLLHELQENPLS